MAGEETTSIALAAVDEAVLARLVHAATTDAVAAEVTPPLTAGEGWTSARVDWLRDFHRARRTGLGGPAGEATWAVLLDGMVVGAVRLKYTNTHGALETGIWLRRSARGRGTGQAALAAVLRLAGTLGATEVWADTTIANAGAMALLSRLGFELTPADDGHGVQARILLDHGSR